jgi:N-acetylglucosaminyldiphosphoundecaprenol N-acetyl-beta-D-mannosaminyltransferase
MRSPLNSYRIIGTHIHATSYEDACDRIEEWIKAHQSIYIVAANVHVVMTAHWHQSYQQVLAQAGLVTPDGMPLVWGLKLLGAPNQTRVYGPDLMLAWCDRASQLGYPIYLYGSTESTLHCLRNSLKQRFTELAIAGSYAPSYGEIDPESFVSDLDRIKRSGAKVLFVGLGCPKQEYWMAKAQGKINIVMIGVGAAFDFHSGQISQAPRWMMKLGLEWMYRFSQEPKRLWQRYLINNPIFIVLFAWQLLLQAFTRNFGNKL